MALARPVSGDRIYIIPIMCKSHYELRKIGSIRECVHCSNSELQFIELYTCTCSKNLNRRLSTESSFTAIFCSSRLENINRRRKEKVKTWKKKCVSLDKWKLFERLCRRNESVSEPKRILPVLLGEAKQVARKWK